MLLERFGLAGAAEERFLTLLGDVDVADGVARDGAAATGDID